MAGGELTQLDRNAQNIDKILNLSSKKLKPHGLQ